MGRPLLPQSFIDEHKRERCVRALAQTAHEVGLESTTVSSIVNGARVSRATFYTLFDDQKAALRYADQLGTKLLKEAIDGGVTAAKGWEARIEAATAALVKVACEEQHLTELCLNGQGGGELAALLGSLIGEGRAGDKSAGPGQHTEELLSRGIVAIVVDRLRREDLEALSRLGAALAEVATAPFRSGSQTIRATARQ